MINNNLNPLIPKKRKKIIYSKNKAKPQFIKHPNQKKYETQKRKKSYLYQNDACEISSPSLSLSYHFDASCFFFHLLIHHHEKINKCWQIKRITIHIKGKKRRKLKPSESEDELLFLLFFFFSFDFLSLPIFDLQLLCDLQISVWDLKLENDWAVSAFFNCQALVCNFLVFFYGPSK